MRNLLYVNEFYLHEKEPVDRTYFHMNDFAQRLVLTQAKWNSKMANWLKDKLSTEKCNWEKSILVDNIERCRVQRV